MAKLTIHDGGRATIHEILDDTVLIGRKDGAAIRISDPTAGAEHCQVRAMPGGGYKLIDLESREGTKVNGAFVNQHLLRDGDVIQIGQVRIGFAAEGTPMATPVQPAATRPLPAGPALRADARQALPVRRAAMPARPRPRPGGGPRPDGGDDWEERPRRVARRASITPIIILGTVVGLLVFAVVIILTAGQWYDHGTNKTVYYDMRDYFRASRFEEAIAIAADADPNEDQKYYRRIQQLLEECRGVVATKARERDDRRAWLDFNKIEHFQKRYRNDKAGAAAKWDEFIARYDVPPGVSEPDYVRRAKIKREELAAVGAGTTDPVAPTGDGKIDRAWRSAKQTAEALEEGDYFQKAINAIQNFWDENQNLAAPGSGWDERVNNQVRAIESRARVQYEQIESYVQQYVNRGEYKEAIGQYQRVIDRFGIESYRERARAGIEKLK